MIAPDAVPLWLLSLVALVFVALLLGEFATAAYRRASTARPRQPLVARRRATPRPTWRPSPPQPRLAPAAPRQPTEPLSYSRAATLPAGPQASERGVGTAQPRSREELLKLVVTSAGIYWN
jgi:hypothetical protein